MIRSYSIFVGKRNLKIYIISFVALLVITAALGVINRTVDIGSINNLIPNLLRIFIVALMPSLSLVLLANIYNVNCSDQPCGYKYFHALPNSSEYYVNAILFGNIMSLIIVISYSAILLTFFDLTMTIVMLELVLFALGVMNLFGHTHSVAARLAPLGVLGFAAGIYMANIDRETSKAIGSTGFYRIFGIITAAVYITGTVYAIVRAKAAWEKESDK